MLVNSDEMEATPLKWLVDGMLPAKGLGFVYGPSYVGKSFLVNGELALAVANGTPFFGRETMKGNVIVALGEGEADARIRKTARVVREESDRRAMADAMGRDGEEWLDGLPPFDGTNLQFWTDAFTVPVTRSGWTGGEGEVTQSLRHFIQSARKVKPRLIILDSLSDFSGGLSISNDTSANRMILGIKEIVRELECCVLVIAHSDKQGRGMLGAGRLFNAADFVVKVDPAKDKNSAMLVSEKNKYGQKFGTTGYALETVEWFTPEYDDDGEPTGNVFLISSATVRPFDLEPVLRPEVIPFDDDIELEERTNGQEGYRSQLSLDAIGLINSRVEGISMKEIAEALDVDPKRLKVYLFRAVKRKDVAKGKDGLYRPVLDLA